MGLKTLKKKKTKGFSESKNHQPDQDQLSFHLTEWRKKKTNNYSFLNSKTWKSRWIGSITQTATTCSVTVLCL